MKNINTIQKKTVKLRILTMVLIMMLFFISSNESFATSDGVLPDEAFQKLQNRFKDLDNTWYTAHVQWSSENEYVKGYADNTFKPNNEMTEAEFATLLICYCSNVEDPGSSSKGHWSQGVYDALAKWEMPLKGYNNDLLKDKAITRGQVAKVVAAKNGFNLNEKQAIYYMYENKLSNGVSEGLILETYGKDLPLTRGATVTFLHRLNQASLTEFNGEYSTAGTNIDGIDGVPPSDVTVDFSVLQEEPEVIVDTGVEDAVTVLTETPRDAVVTQVTEDIQEVYGITYDNNAIETGMDRIEEMLKKHKEFEALVEPTIKFDPDTRILTMDVPHLPDNLDWNGVIELATADGMRVQEYRVYQYKPAPYDKLMRVRIDINEFQGQKIELDLKQDETLDWDSKDRLKVFMNCENLIGDDTGGSAYYEYWLE